jgi:hypothetical protein
MFCEVGDGKVVTLLGCCVVNVVLCSRAGGTGVPGEWGFFLVMIAIIVWLPFSGTFRGAIGERRRGDTDSIIVETSEDRGRYPEEVSEDRDVPRCQTPSDDSDYEDADTTISFCTSDPRADHDQDADASGQRERESVWQ